LGNFEWIIGCTFFNLNVQQDTPFDKINVAYGCNKFANLFSSISAILAE